MRSIFMVGGKLLGLVVVYRAVFRLPVFAAYAGRTLSLLLGEEPAGDPHRTLVLIQTVVFAFELLVLILLTALLLFKTDWLADRLGVLEDSVPAGVPSAAVLMRLGVMLVGLCVMLMMVPKAPKVVVDFLELIRTEHYRREGLSAMASGQVGDILEAVLGIVLPAICLFRPGWVMKLLSGDTAQGEGA